MSAPPAATNAPAGTAAPKDAAAGASNSAALPVSKEASYPMPSSVQKAQFKLDNAHPAATAAPAPTEYVVAPPRGTLAAGRWEAKPSTIWIVVAFGLLMVLLWALFRVRRATNEKKKQLEALTTLRRSRPSA